MTDLIHLNTQIALSHCLKDDPFAYLFFSHLPANLPLPAKTQYLKEFCVALSKLESHAENNLTRNHWLCITSGFSAAITVAGSTALLPLGGMILSGAAVVATVTMILDVVATKNQVEAIVQDLKRHRLALESQQSVQWAALWQFAESDLFCRALAYASRGFVAEGRLIQRGDDTPFQRAIDFVAECRGLQYMEVVEGARALMNAKQSVPSSADKPRLNPASLEHSETRAIAPNPVEQKPVETTPSEVTPSPAGNAKVSRPAPSSTKWINNFVSQTGLIWGNQGSGKSWMARYVAKLKKDKGYRVVVLDPDSNRAEWEGVESYHDFDEIVEFLRWYVNELMARYKAFNASSMTEDAWRAKLWADGKALAVIAEEVTTYADLIEDKDLLTQFFRLGLTKSRKQEMPLTFVSHNNNQTALGGIRGLANLIEKMLQLELQTDIDPDTLQPVASGKGAVKLDGSSQWVPVTLPKLEQKITNFGEVQPAVLQQSDVQPERTKEPLNDTEPDEVERLNALINKPFNDSEPSGLSEPSSLNLDPFSPGITHQERGEVVSERRDGRSKEETIFLVWGAKKGGSKAYLAAKEKLDRILSESGLE